MPGFHCQLDAPAGRAADLAWRDRCRGLAGSGRHRGAGRRPLVALWASGAVPRAPHDQRRLRAGGRPGVARTAARHGRPGYPDLAALFPAAGRMQRAAADLSGVRAVGAADTRPWLNHGAWPAGFFPLQHPAASEAGLGAGPRLPLRARRRRRRARDRRRPGACRHHRAGPLPLFRGRRKGAAAGGAAGLHPQGHGAALHPAAAAGGLSPGRAGLRRFHRGLCLGLLHGAGIGRRLRDPATRAVAACAAAGARAGRQPPGRPGRAGQRRRLRRGPGAVLPAAGGLAAPVRRCSATAS